MSLIVRTDKERFRYEHRLVRNAKDDSLMVLVPGGEFDMGDGQDTNCPKHRVWVDAFYIGVYCVTRGQWAKFKDGRDGKDKDHPVVAVTWDDAMAYANWAGCALPTEAQWEKAARGPKGLVYPWGNEWDENKCRNSTNNGNEQTAAVGEYAEGVSGYGTCQQSGNVWEWCRDWSGDYVTAGTQRNPTGPATGSYRVIRGGSWDSGVVVAHRYRGAYRNGYDASGRYGSLGFRLVRAAPEPCGEGGRTAS